MRKGHWNRCLIAVAGALLGFKGIRRTQSSSMPLLHEVAGLTPILRCGRVCMFRVGRMSGIWKIEQ